MSSSSKKKPESYKKIKELGKGACGKAYLVQAESDKSYAVIKQIDVNAIKTRAEREKVYQESKIMEKFDNKFIVGFKEVYKTKSAKLCIVMDYCDGGDLAQKIKKHATSRKYIKEDLILDWLTQMCLALQHIHSHKVIHRDIKAQNIFMMADGTIRFGDFGVARVLDYTLAKAQTQVGTPYYISPEILRGRSYTYKADVWSLGILLFELCALDVPIKAGSLHDLYRRIMNFRKLPSLPSQYSKTMKDLISSMVTTDASKRPSIKDLLAHPEVSGRISKFMTEEEQKAQFGGAIPKSPSLSKKAPLPSPHSKPTTPSSYPKKAPPRFGQGFKEESKGTPSRVGKAKVGGLNGRPAPSRPYSARDRAGNLASKKPLASKDQNRPPVLGKNVDVPKMGNPKLGTPKMGTPKLGMGARKNSAGALHARRNSAGMGVKNSPGKANFHFANKYGKPAPSQTPRNNGAAKKLAAKAPVGFQKQRPGSARGAVKRPGSAAGVANQYKANANYRRFY